MPSSRFASSCRHGFTLLELAIVLVIIGLITGGILAGQEMVRASELQRVIKEKDKIFVAMESFRLKFLQIPGDFSKATDFWGVNTAGCPYGGDVTGTCNGDGNGLLNWQGWGDVSESYRFWQHLTLAGMYPGQFRGKPWISGQYIVANESVPPIPGGGLWAMTNVAENTAETFNIFGNALVAMGGGFWYQLFTPEDAKRIDKKADDGMSATGKVTGATYVAGCATAADYTLATKSVACPLFFWLNK